MFVFIIWMSLSFTLSQSGESEEPKLQRVQDKLSHLEYWNLDIIMFPQRSVKRDCILVKGYGENKETTS